MSPTMFPQANCTMDAPHDLASQVESMAAYVGNVEGGGLDGQPIVIVAWQPDDVDRDRIAAGGPIFLQCFGGLPAHSLSTKAFQ